MGQPAVANSSDTTAPETAGLGQAWLAERPGIDDPAIPVECFVRHLSGDEAGRFCRLLESWRSDGVIVLEGVVPHDLIDAFLYDLETLKNDPRRYHVEINHAARRFYSDDLCETLSRADFNDQYFRICQVHWISKVASELALIPEVAQFISLVFQQPAAILQSLTFLKSSQQPLHIDYPYVRAQRKLAFMLASWIPLEDVHPDAGPLVYYPGGHKPEVSGFFEWSPGEILQDERSHRTPHDFAAYLESRMVANRIRARIFLPRKGDVLLWHGNLPHSGSSIRNTALTRRSLVTHYTSEDCLPSWWSPFAGDASRLIVDNGFGRSWEPPWAPASKLPSWSA